MNISFTSKLGEDAAKKAYQAYIVSQGDISDDSLLKQTVKPDTVNKASEFFTAKGKEVLGLFEQRSFVLKQPELDEFMKNNSDKFAEDQTIKPDTLSSKNLIDNYFDETQKDLETLRLATSNYDNVKRSWEIVTEKNKTRSAEEQKFVPVLPDTEDYGWVKLANNFIEKALTNISNSHKK